MLPAGTLSIPMGDFLDLEVDLCDNYKFEARKSAKIRKHAMKQ